MNLSIGFEPLASWPVIAVAGIVLLALAAIGLYLRLRGAVFRLVASIALAGALINPVVLDEEREPLTSIVALIVDRSQSQDIGERGAQTDDTVERLLAKLARFPQFDVRRIEAGRSAKAEERTETRIFEALESAIRDVPPSRVAGAIVVTDGQIHDLPDQDRPPFPAPLHALITGGENEFDRRIRFEKAPRFGITGKPLEMTYRVAASTGETGQIDVRVSINGDLVAVTRAEIGVETPLGIEIPHAGRNIVELSIARRPEEITDINNKAIAVVEGIRENLRVLLVSGEPHAGERTWRNLLKSDASVDLVHFMILRPPEKQDGTPITDLSLIAFPTRELFIEKIDDFDLIIFDRYQNRDVLPILYYDYIAQYIARGGALMVAAGPEYSGDRSIARTPLIAALPASPTGEVIDEAFYPRLTEIGAKHPVTRGLDGAATEPPDWGRWFRLVGISDTRGAAVMKGAGDRPLLLLDRLEQGRVGMLLSDQGWLWARGLEGGGPHVSLYRRIAHWLMKEPELEEERLYAEGRGMTLEIRRQTMNDDPGPATLTSPSGKTIDTDLTEAEPGVFSTTIDADEIGLHRVGNGDLVALAHVGPVNAPEFADMASTEQLLRARAEKTGGGVRRVARRSGVSVPGIAPVRHTGNASGRDWIGLRATDDSILKAVNRAPLFGGFLGLGALLLALGSMWRREGR